MSRRELGVGASIAGRLLEAEIGRGGMGVVYRASNERLERTEAVKVITDELARDRSFRERFLGEAMIAIAVEHPHVIPVYDADEASGGHLFIAMRYVEDGHNLSHLISQHGRLEPPIAVQIVSDIASALDAAHARDLVHRDVKPTNILIVDERSRHSYLTDFGLSKRVSAHTTVSGTGGVVGTVDYMPPEQAQGHEVDVRADVYALGVTLFEALTGQVPFPLADDDARLQAKIRELPPMITQVATGIPVGFDAVLARALARDPAERYASAGELGRAAQEVGGRASIISTRGEIGVGSVVADCLIEEVAGEGGMAIVYRATQRNLGRTVALKVMSPGLADRADFRVRFEREWKVAAALEHPNVVPILWAGESQGRLFIVMRFVEGETLRETLARVGRLEPQRAVAVLEHLASALDSAHSRGLVHRDIKPGNVLVEAATGRVFLTDFGLAKSIDDEDDITDVGDRVMGTARYMPPERHSGFEIDEVLGDVYSLGCLLWDMLGGTERPRLDTIEDLPADLRQVVVRAMSPDPGARFRSAGEMAEAARAAVDEAAAAQLDFDAEGGTGRASGLGLAAEPRQPFELAPLSSGLSQRVLGLCNSVLRTGTLAGEALAELEEVRERLTAPLRMLVLGRAGSGRSALVNSIVGYRVNGARAYGELAEVARFSFETEEGFAAERAGGERIEDGLDPDGRLPAAILEREERLAALDVRLPVDSLRTVSVTIGPALGSNGEAAAGEAAADTGDAFLIALPADRAEEAPGLAAALAARPASRRFSAVNVAVALTKADLVGEDLAGHVAGVEEAFGLMIATATPVNALLAQNSAKSAAVNEDVAVLTELARLTDPSREEMLASAQAFLDFEGALAQEERRGLLDRYGVAGLRVAFELADSGELTGVGLRRRLREVSGLAGIEATVDGFHQRGDALRAGRALETLEELSYRHPELAMIRDHVESIRLEPEMHLIDLIGAYQRCVSEPESVGVPDELSAALMRLITGRTPAERFGLEPGVGPDELRAAALDGFRAWKAFENAGNASPAGRRVSRRVARSYEHYARERESETN